MTSKKTTEPVRIQASKLPRAKVCPASVAQSIGKLSPSSEYASFGKAFHECMEIATSNGRENVDVDAVAGKHGIVGKANSELHWMWNRFTFDPTGGMAEVDVLLQGDGFVVSGRIDHVGPIDEAGTYRVTDYKTGWRIEEDLEPWHDPQTMAYGIGVLESVPESVRVLTYKAYTRKGDNGWSAPLEISEFNFALVRGEVMEIAQRAFDQIGKVESKRDYTVSHHCGYCPGRIDCPAVRQEFNAVLAATEIRPKIKKNGEDSKVMEVISSIEITTDNAGKYHGTVKLMRRGADALSKRIHEFVDTMGPVEIEEGKYLAVIMQGRRVNLTRKLFYTKAAEAGLTSEQMTKLWNLMESRPKDFNGKLDVYSEAKLLGDGD